MWQLLLGALLSAALTLGPAVASGPAGRSAEGAGEARAGQPATATRATAGTTKRFWVTDRHRYSSPWYAGERRKMIPFGCTRAPYYDPDPRCTGDRGFHHGLDMAMPCGTRLFAGLPGRVVRPGSAGALGPSYGARAFRIRNAKRDVDIVVAHVRRVYVDPGDRVRKGQLVARASDAAAPDGCHLHFEVRPSGTGYTSAVRPHDYLMLAR